MVELTITAHMAACWAAIREMVPAMAEGVPSCHNRGVIAENVQQLIVENVSITGIQGPEVEQQ